MEDPLGMEGPSMVLRPDEEKLFEGQPKGFPLGGFNIDDVMLPEGDNMGIESEDDDDVEDEIEAESGFGSVIGDSPCVTLLYFLSALYQLRRLAI